MNAPLYYKNSNSSSQIIIKDSRFDSNVAEKHENNYWPNLCGAVFLYQNGKSIILNSTFENNMGYSSGALYLERVNSISPASTEIINSTFSSNTGFTTAAIYHYSVKLSIDNTNFTNNIVAYDKDLFYYDDYSDQYYGYDFGSVILTEHNDLTINHTNFIGNGVPLNISENYFGNQYGGIIRFSAPDYNLTIDNTNFTSNTGVEQGGIIYSERITTQQEIKPPHYSIDDRLSDNRVLINNTIFSNNKLLDKIYWGQAKGIVLYLRGNTIIDNTQFISNRYVPNSNQEYNEEPTGVIYKESDWYSSYFCDITNCDFINNDPENFIINNNEIVEIL